MVVFYTIIGWAFGIAAIMAGLALEMRLINIILLFHATSTMGVLLSAVVMEKLNTKRASVIAKSRAQNKNDLPLWIL